MYNVKTMIAKQLPARQRILETAKRLFSRNGFRAVGIDTIIAEAGVAKMSLYRHFPAKDDLIIAYLEGDRREFWEWLDNATAHTEDPAEQLVGIFAALERLVASPQCRGCSHQSATAEFPDPDHPVHQLSVAHKLDIRARFADLALQANLREPEELAFQLQFLMEGALVAARMFGPDDTGTGLTDAATTLINARR